MLRKVKYFACFRCTKPWTVAKLKEAVREKQFEELNKKGQLEKWMAKKSKRKASKQRKQMPNRRMQNAGE